MDFKLFLNFRAKLLLSLMLVVLVVTGTTAYLVEQNAQTRYQEALDAKFQEQMGLFSALQETRRRAVLEKCRAVSRSVRLRAALEEDDAVDLYQNAATELQDLFDVRPGINERDSQVPRALFFRFVRANGKVVSPGDFPAGMVAKESLDQALALDGSTLTNGTDQTIGYIAANQRKNLNALREVVLTRLQDWDGRSLGGLVLGFGVRDLISFERNAASISASGIWLREQLYMNNGMSAADREALTGTLAVALGQGSSGHYQVTYRNQPHLLFFKRLGAATQIQPAYEVCLYPLGAVLRQQQTLRWKILGVGALVLAGGFIGSIFLTRELSAPVDKIVAGSVENLTRRRRAEQDLSEANRELESALRELKSTQQQIIQQERLRALGEMASGIAHDFNNTLTPILGFTDLLLERPELLEDTVEATRFLNLLRTSAKDAASIVRRLREFYRPLETQDTVSAVDLVSLVTQVVSLTEPKWRQQAQANGSTIRVETEMATIAPVAADESALREALTNLIFNAVDAMPAGGLITLRVTTEDDQAILQIQDSGTGMTEEVRQRCLEPFFSTKGDHGTGLGLAMVYGIIKRHGGTMDIASKLEQGTTFTIRLPFAKPAEKSETEETLEPAERSSLKVLLVDDEPGTREVISAFLRSDGHLVTTANNGREGLREFRAQPFDVIVTDRAMPEMNGDQMAGMIKEARPDIPIVLLTGFGLPTTDQPPAAIDVVLNKPVTLKTLLGTIETLRHAA